MAKRGSEKFGMKIDPRWDVPPMSEEERRQRMCGDKELRTERDAKTQAQMNNGRGRPSRAYKCEYCDWWHIGTDKFAL